MNDGWNFPVIPIGVPEFNGLLAGKARARIFRELRKKKGGKEEKIASKYNRLTEACRCYFRLQ